MNGRRIASILLLALGTGSVTAQNTLPTTGNVGIGTTGPGSPLTVQAPASFGGGTGGSVVHLSGPDGYNMADFFYGGDKEAFFNLTDGSSQTTPVQFRTNGPSYIDGGNVGIGTSSPQYSLDVAGTIRSTSGGIVFPDGTWQRSASFSGNGNYQVATNYVDGQGTTVTNQIVNWGVGYQWQVNSNVGYGTIASLFTTGGGLSLPSGQFNLYSGTSTPAGQATVQLGGGTNSNSYFNSGGNVGIGTTTPSAPLEVNGSTLVDGNLAVKGQGGITFYDNTVQSTAFTGVVCGGDYAESVDVTGNRVSYEPGDVLVIDPGSEGNFLKSAQPYSTGVTGIYSTKPGVVGRRQQTDRSHMKDEVPMAMTGIVPTKVIAENGPIKAGDLLVTSSKLGYAMKGTDRTQMLGAVIGKALGHLDSGTGVIEVVVTLQ